MKRIFKLMILLALAGLIILILTSCIGKYTKAGAVGSTTAAATGSPIAGIAAGGASLFIEIIDETVSPSAPGRVLDRASVKIRYIGWILLGAAGLLLWYFIWLNKEKNHYKERKKLYKEKAAYMQGANSREKAE